MKVAREEQPRSRPPTDGSAGGDKEEVILKYLPLVRYVAEKVYRRLPPGIDLESLVHSGVVGLIEALDRFDPRRGVDFEIYARYRIEGEVMQCLRSLDWVSRSVRSWGRKIEAARAKLTAALVREPTADEMAQELAIPLETYFQLDRQVNGATLLSLESLSIGSDQDLESARERYTNDTSLDPLSFVENKDLVEKLAAAIDTLPERERLVVTLYYHEELTLREIGQVFDLSEGRICQIFAQAIARLRDSLGENGPPKRPTGRRKERDRKRAEAIEAATGAAGVNRNDRGRI